MGAQTRFLSDESGSATVEWVVMTAASVAIGMTVMSYVSAGVESLSTEIREALSGFMKIGRAHV